jgi:prepilin-type processing-associated H-X9-DG protein
MEMAMSSHHAGGANFFLGDGSVRFIRDTIPLATYRALASRNGGETITTINRDVHVLANARDCSLRRHRRM